MSGVLEFFPNEQKTSLLKRILLQKQLSFKKKMYTMLLGSRGGRQDHHLGNASGQYCLSYQDSLPLAVLLLTCYTDIKTHIAMK